MSRKNPLGRGLGALLENYSNEEITSRYSSPEPASPPGKVFNIPLSNIETNPFQPRTSFDDRLLQELAQSIKEVGLIQPVTVRKTGVDRYQLISGERRYLASKICGLTEIPAYVRIADDKEMLGLALIENVQREDLDAIEIALGFERLIDECGFTHEELSRKMGKDRSTITNFLRLLKLPAVIQLALKQKKISMAHARTLIAVEDTSRQLEYFDRILTHELSVRETEHLVKEFKRTGRSTPEHDSDNLHSQPVSSSEKSRAIIYAISRKTGTDVNIRMNNKGGGRIVIPFESEEKLLAIASALGI
ncbi:MAG: ParB/RepB/Spo0J family partition protein [Bacteroidetes bacterium]|nr:ParB/RepB/Spo0J family partition protein [Bacteroidota bacterium]